ncbi:GntR family transcriptional regulator [Maribacter sp. MMG018]|uniref:GntR family transcriptional regulator n=1 Tax=Maribacter sp. MMG018 TaxID=2822688 RepID=UPI001B382867|nr:GntR family transcriptional regulator [Maribacter sp. MMG018]MBQ4913167.1 GntR family transcriptional regulator [Maribacter sp. MMG018]
MYYSEQLQESCEEVYVQLHKLILTKKLKRGEPLDQEHLSRKLSANGDCLEQAFKRLSKESLVVYEPGQGISVREVSTSEVIDVLDCRIALETSAVKFFTLRAPQEKIDDLRNLMVPFEKGPENSYVFQKIDRHFHEIIVTNCGNTTLLNLYKKGNFWSIMDLVSPTRSLRDVLQEHLNIISAIHQRDVNRAVSLMNEHLSKCKKSLLC